MAASGSGAVRTLTTFVEVERFERVYTGGKVAAHGSSFIVCPCGAEVNVIDLASGKVVITVPAAADEFTAFALRPDGKQLVTAGRSRQLRSWSLDVSARSCECARVWKGHKMPIMDLSFDGTGTLCASASADASAMVFDVDRAVATHVFRGHEGVLHLALFHPDTSRLRLLTAAADNTVRVWDLHSRACVGTLRSHVGLPTALAFSPNGATLFTAGRDQLVNVWRWSDLKLSTSITVLEPLEGIIATGGSEDGAAPKPTPKKDTKGRPASDDADEPLRFTTAGEGGLLRTWDARSGHRIAVATNSELVKVFNTHGMGCQLLFGHTDVVLALDVDQAGGLLTSASKDGTARVWRATDGACVGLCEGHVDAVGALSFARNGSWLLTGSKDKTVKLWDISGIERPWQPAKAAAGGAAKKQKKADGGAVVGSAAAVAAPLLQKPRAKSTVVGHAKEINAIAVAPNDKLSASASQDRTIKVWTLGSQGALQEAGVLKGHKRAVWCAAFSPVDRALASGSGDMTLRVWSMSDFSCLRTLSGHTSSVLRVHWVSAGTQLLSSGSDGLVKLWSAKASDCVTTLDGHEDKVWALDVAHAADGSEGLEVWSGSADSVLVRWRDSSKEEQEEASAKRELELQHEQELAIAVHAREYDSALRLALRLRHPRSLRTVLEKLLPTDDGEDQLKALVATMDQEDLAHCLRCARDWNTTATHSLVAQRLMYAVLRSTPLSKLNATPQLKELLEALIPYTERHFERLDRLQQSSQFLSYTLSAMKGPQDR